MLEAADAPPPGPVDVDSSYVSRDPYTDVPVASCERRGTESGVSTLTVLEVRVADTPAQASEVQAKHLDNRYPPGTRIRKVTTDAGPAYVVDLGGTPTAPWRSRAIQVVVGPYELHLNALAGVTEKRPYGQWADVEDLVAAADELAASLGSEGESDVP